jgi:hypothetical protein
MRQNLSGLFNDFGNAASDAGKLIRAERHYRIASKIAPRWSVPWYNLGLLTKNSGRWKESLAFNQRALLLNLQDEGACWNLGIAATALREWPEARRAWTLYGTEVGKGHEEIVTPTTYACVRLNPNGSGEVVWGNRLDPARIIVLNVPLPESKHRFRDVILNDGASNGTRDRSGVQVPVFDELQIWQPSDYCTFEVQLCGLAETSEDQLTQLCHAADLGIEDWSSIRVLCGECSRGNPGPHDCKSSESTGIRRFGIAARQYEDVSKVLKNWAAVNAGGKYSDLRLALDARLQ